MKIHPVCKELKKKSVEAAKSYLKFLDSNDPNEKTRKDLQKRMIVSAVSFKVCQNIMKRYSIKKKEK